MSESITIYVGPVPLKFIWCPPGRFTMGRYITPRRGPLRERIIEFTEGFWLLETPATEELKSIFNVNVPDWKKRKPITGLSYFDALEFCDKLKQFDGREFSLPTEAQWEYACAGGTHSSIGGAKSLSSVAWYSYNARYQLPSVKERNPNNWGFYDMLGGVYELCLDDFQDYINADRTDEVAYDYVYSSNLRPHLCVTKGGCMYCNRSLCQVASRHGIEKEDQLDIVGFRLVLK